MIHIKSAIRQTAENTLWIIILTALFSAFFVLLILLHWDSWAQFYGARLCMADGFVLLQSKRFFPFVFMPLYLLLTSFAVRNDFSPIYILRHRKRDSVYMIQIIKLCFFTVLYVVFLQIAVGILSALLFPDTMNWELRNSLFYFITVQTAAYPFWQVVLYTSTILAVLLQTVGLVFVLIRWVTGSMVYSWLAEIILCIAYCRQKSDSLWNIYGVEHTVWIGQSTLLFHIVIAFALCILLLLVGLYIVRKKDFIQ